MLLRNVRNVMARGVNGMALIFLVPISEVRGLMHVLDNLPPADAGVVGAERNLAFLGAVGNDAHLCAAKIVVEKILKPHAFDAEHTPVVGRVGVLAGARHAIVAIGVRVSR